MIDETTPFHASLSNNGTQSEQGETQSQKQDEDIDVNDAAKRIFGPAPGATDSVEAQLDAGFFCARFRRLRKE